MSDPSPTADYGGRYRDERAIALVVEWWMRTPVPEYEDDSSDDAASMEDVRLLFEHLEANGYTIAPLPHNGSSAAEPADG